MFSKNLRVTVVYIPQEAIPSYIRSIQHTLLTEAQRLNVLYIHG